MNGSETIYAEAKIIFERQYTYDPRDRGKYMRVDIDSGEMKMADRLEDLLMNHPPEKKCGLFRIGFRDLFSLS